MRDKLQGLLLGYIRENNPDLLFQLEEDDALHAWVLEKIQEVELVLQNSKPSLLMEADYLDLMTAELKPSKFHYIRDLLEEAFPAEYEQMKASGALSIEVVNMISACKGLFDEFPLSEDMEENLALDHAATGVISDFLQGAYE